MTSTLTETEALACLACGQPVEEQDALWGSLGEAYDTEACREAVDR